MGEDVNGELTGRRKTVMAVVGDGKYWTAAHVHQQLPAMNPNSIRNVLRDLVARGLLDEISMPCGPGRTPGHKGGRVHVYRATKP